MWEVIAEWFVVFARSEQRDVNIIQAPAERATVNPVLPSFGHLRVYEDHSSTPETLSKNS